MKRSIVAKIRLTPPSPKAASFLYSLTQSKFWRWRRRQARVLQLTNCRSRAHSFWFFCSNALRQRTRSRSSPPSPGDRARVRARARERGFCSALSRAVVTHISACRRALRPSECAPAICLLLVSKRLEGRSRSLFKLHAERRQTFYFFVIFKFFKQYFHYAHNKRSIAA